MKTGLLKWKPDYEGASVEYGKAGKFCVKLNVFCYLTVVCFLYYFYIKCIFVSDSVCHHDCSLVTYLLVCFCGWEFCWSVVLPKVLVIVAKNNVRYPFFILCFEQYNLLKALISFKVKVVLLMYYYYGPSSYIILLLD